MPCCCTGAAKARPRDQAPPLLLSPEAGAFAPGLTLVGSGAFSYQVAHNIKKDERHVAEIMSSALGKLTVPLSLKLSVDTYEELQALATRAGMTTTEFVRRLIEIRVYGEAHILSIEAERVAVVSGRKLDGQR